jgi:hypothetical protein
MRSEGDGISTGEGRALNFRDRHPLKAEPAGALRARRYENAATKEILLTAPVVGRMSKGQLPLSSRGETTRQEARGRGGFTGAYSNGDCAR